MQSDAIEARMVARATDLAGVDAELLRQGLQISQLHRRVEARFEQGWSQWGLSAIQMRILIYLFHSEDIVTPILLADYVDLSPSAMTSALDGLERRDYLKRCPHTDDRRKVVVQLTNDGSAFIEAHLPALYQKICATMGCLSKHEREVFVRAYGKVLAYLEASG